MLHFRRMLGATPPHAWPRLTERKQQIIDRSIPIIERRMLVKATVQREGAHRILLQVPGIGDPRRLEPTSGMMSD